MKEKIDEFKQILEQCRKRFFYLIGGVFTFIILAFNLFYGLSKYYNILDNIEQSEITINRAKDQIEQNLKKGKEYQNLIKAFDNNIATYNDSYKKWQKYKLNNYEKLSSHLEWLKRTENRYKLEPNINFIKYKKYFHFFKSSQGIDFVNKLLEIRTNIEENQRFKIPNNFNNDYKKVFRKIRKQKIRIELYRIKAELKKGSINKNAIEQDKNGNGNGNGSFNLETLKNALLTHQAFFYQLQMLPEKVKEAEQKSRIALGSENEYLKYQAKIKEDTNKRDFIKKKLEDKEFQNNQLEKGIVTEEVKLKQLNKLKLNTFPELFKAFEISGVPVSSTAIVPLTPIILVFIFLWFLFHFERLANKAKLLEKENLIPTGMHSELSEEIEAQISPTKTFHIEFGWFLIYREKITWFVSAIVMFLPVLYSHTILLMTRYYIKYIINNADLAFEYPMGGLTYYIINIIATVLLLYFAFRTFILRKRILKHRKFKIN